MNNLQRGTSGGFSNLSTTGDGEFVLLPTYGYQYYIFERLVKNRGRGDNMKVNHTNRSPQGTPHLRSHLFTNQMSFLPFLASGNSYSVYVLVRLQLFRIPNRKVSLCYSKYAQLISQMLIW